MPVNKPSPNVSVDSLSYRPRNYFGDFDLEASLMTKVKGTVRRKAIRSALARGEISSVPNEVKEGSLDDENRSMLGSIHPAFMGGEYLPNPKDDEVEIARISISSTTGDVTCVYARPQAGGIRYEVRDEYGGDTLSGLNTRTSTDPLTMGELIDFFLGSWSLHECLECNFENDVEGMLTFFSAESEFYPCLDSTLRKGVIEKFERSSE